MSENKSKKRVLDPEVEEELKNVGNESEIIGTYSSEGGNSDKIPILKDWLPNRDEWKGKTQISARQAQFLAMARNLPQAYEEIEHLDPFIKNLLDDYEQYLTSVNGLSREQQKSVLMAMFGKGSDEDGARNMLLGAIAGDSSKDD